MRKARELVAVSLVVGVAACGGSKSAEKSGATTGIGSSGEGAESGELHIPKVDNSLCDTGSKSVQQYDLNKDSKPDVWKLYKVQNQKGTDVNVLTCKQVDLDHDGKKDYVVTYDDSGNIITEDYDFDFDGKFDARIHYDTRTNQKYMVERVTNFQGKPDIWEKYDRKEQLEQLQRDRNGDGKPDYWEQYQTGNLDQILYDDNYDGKVDRKERVVTAAAPADPNAPAPAADPAAPPEEDSATTPTEPAAPPPAAEPEKKPAKKKKGK